MSSFECKAYAKKCRGSPHASDDNQTIYCYETIISREIPMKFMLSIVEDPEDLMSLARSPSSAENNQNYDMNKIPHKCERHKTTAK